MKEFSQRQRILQMHSLQTARICYFGFVKNRLHIIVLLAFCGMFSLAHANTPKPKTETDNSQESDILPISQEATEESVLPEEPLLSLPTPEAAAEYMGLPVQALPPDGISAPSGPTVDEKRLSAEAFRAAKTEAEEQFTLADIKLRAFEAPTEREKRALLREYYQAISAYITKSSPNLKDKAQTWAYAQQNRLGRRRTEPDYLPPMKPEGLGGTALDSPDEKPQANATPEESANFVPLLDN